MKRPSEVGTDFDEYARRWRKERYQLETGGSGTGVVTDASRSDELQRPGDEWGDIAPLRSSYADLVARFHPGSGPVNVLEIGAGGGRSTAVLLEVLGTRAADYHVVDVSAGFIEVLKDRVSRPIEVHIVDDVDLTGLPMEHFDLCLAQSSWSHINLYDQYRYLRELRGVLRPGAPIYVSGQFLLGVGNDWTWNRFKRRVGQIDRSLDGVYHEVTSVAALAEMLVRLQYEIVCINTAGFVAKRARRYDAGGLVTLQGPIVFPFNPSSPDFLATGRTEVLQLPTVGVAGDIRRPSPAGARRSPSVGWKPRVRQSIERLPGGHALVRWIRQVRKRLAVTRAE